MDVCLSPRDMKKWSVNRKEDPADKRFHEFMASSSKEKPMDDRMNWIF